MTITQGYARLLRRYAGDLAAQCMPIKAEAMRQAARHMEELQAINDQAGEAVERLRVTLHHVRSGRSTRCRCGKRRTTHDGQANAGLAAALPKRGTTGVTMNLEQVAPAAETEGNREFF